MKLNLLKIRGLVATVAHVLIMLASIAVSLWIRFDFASAILDSSLFVVGVMVILPVKTLVFLAGGLQRGWWRYAGLTDLVRIFFVNIAASGLSALILFRIFGPGFPRSVYAIDFLVCFLMTSASRFCVRIYNETLKTELVARDKGILIYGAGAAARTLLREIRANPSLGFQVVGFIDDNSALGSVSIMGVPVLGTGRQIATIVERYKNRLPKLDQVVVAMPSATSRQMREAHANCRAAGITCKTVPGIADRLNGKYLTQQIRSISLEDLLGREQIRLDHNEIEASIAGNSILITGAAGSIGSELCRQTASFRPHLIVLLDHAESELFRIEQELRQLHPELTIIPRIGDIRDITALEDIVRTYSIKSIYHAAAYKHVPLMENHLLEAVRNNIIGTWNLVKVAEKCNASNFVMISTDKAVNPTSVMGLTKRIAELIVSAASNDPNNVTNFVSVRFGNVLGSNGSVVPTFQAQIAAGGPVTVTHPEMRRYFMSIREAVQLVLQASTMGKGSEVFVLDMGEPVRIVDLAHNMIQLAGLVPGEDIEIRFTGVRPGEKLFEEISMHGENMLPTHHEKIRIFAGPGLKPEVIENWIAQLSFLVTRQDIPGIRAHLSALVPEYNPYGSAVTSVASAIVDHAKTARAGAEVSGSEMRPRVPTNSLV